MHPVCDAIIKQKCINGNALYFCCPPFVWWHHWVSERTKERINHSFHFINQCEQSWIVLTIYEKWMNKYGHFVRCSLSLGSSSRNYHTFLYIDCDFEIWVRCCCFFSSLLLRHLYVFHYLSANNERRTEHFQWNCPMLFTRTHNTIYTLHHFSYVKWAFHSAYIFCTMIIIIIVLLLLSWFLKIAHYIAMENNLQCLFPQDSLIILSSWITWKHVKWNVLHWRRIHLDCIRLNIRLATMPCVATPFNVNDKYTDSRVEKYEMNDYGKTFLIRCEFRIFLNQIYISIRSWFFVTEFFCHFIWDVLL